MHIKIVHLLTEAANLRMKANVCKRIYALAEAPADLIGPKAAARVIGVSTSWLARRRKPRSKGPPWYRVGGRIHYKITELKNWLEQQRNR